jgi:hypothetical protein
MADKFAIAAQQQALKDLEDDLIYAGRAYEDAERSGDTFSASQAMITYNAKQLEIKELRGDNEPPQQGLTDSEKNFISRRIAQGDELTPARWRDYETGAARALQAGWQRGSPQYLSAIGGYLDSLGDGRQPPLDERTAARLCGIDDETYAAGAAHVRALKARGFYQD